MNIEVINEKSDSIIKTRNIVKNALKTVIKKETNINILEKNIYNLFDLENDDNINTNLEKYKYTAYETIGNIINGEELKSILSNIKSGNVNWNSPFYTEILEQQKEQDDYIENPFEIVEGIFQCVKCNSSKVFSYSKQTRAGDEGSTVFAQCAVCKNKWIASN